MTILSAAEIAKFKTLVATDGSFNEKECSAYLYAATDYLLGVTPFRMKELSLEARSPYGRSDYIIVADIKSGHGAIETHMIFFELKAPQCYLVQLDDARRYRPTNDLVKAETQLIHYVEQAKGDGDLREKHGIVGPHQISAGGIIIARDDHIAKVDSDSKLVDARHSFKLRQRSLYQTWKILTWDRILEYVEPPPGLSL
ncbi:Shedu anti-phage system protein SduA domain-containing protein [Mesorhizobium sp.]|uniref:Shedu anti-phage system protein SduA domain-containing protein n=1 Tax=Mesorhizobium sp. TaxID=1871066 RepID=UPI000FE7F36A|nr:Shedu anti-phage system protein SduA domain-containing protein [Mesorhizobium sp.]RWP64937.1 MAG: DUF4263 domain-containing protein [Mesorhizobium sp.]